jgi:hypothetical protein
VTLTRTVCVLTLLNWKQKKPILFKVGGTHWQSPYVCVSLFYVIDTGSIGSRARIEMGVTYLPFALAQTLAMPIYPYPYWVPQSASRLW